MAGQRRLAPIIQLMLFLLSPAKSLDYDTPAGDLPHTLPSFPEQTRELIEVLR